MGLWLRFKESLSRGVQLVKKCFQEEVAESNVASGRPVQISVPDELKNSPLSLGARSERLARHYLETARGMRFLEANALLKSHREKGRTTGELDLVMELPDAAQTLVFVEVRSRAQYWRKFGSPLCSITHEKQCRVCRAAHYWLLDHEIPLQRPVRFDVVSIVWGPDQLPEVLHIPHAFQWQDFHAYSYGRIH